MPRSLRIQYPGAHYHAMSRGNNGQDIFQSEDGYRLFLSTLDEVCQQTGWVIHAYALMGNHYHLLLETPEPNLVAGMKWFQGTYTQRFNAMFGRWGHLFQGRYKAIPVQAESGPAGLDYFRQVSSYIHLNPFRAGICGPSQDIPLHRFPWSSYPAYAGSARSVPDWLERSKVLASWGLALNRRGRQSYRSALERFMRMNIQSETAVEEETNKQLKRGWYIGSTEFRNTLDERLGGEAEGDNLRGRQRREHSEWEAERLLQAGLSELGWTEEDLLEALSVTPEKQAIAWLIKTHTAVTGSWIARRLKMGHPQNTSRAINRFRREEGPEIQGLKERMSKCVG